MNLKVLEQDSKSKMDKTEKREDLKSWISCTLTLSRDEGSVYLISKSFFLARFSLITGGGWRLLWCMPRNGLFFSHTESFSSITFVKLLLRQTLLSVCSWEMTVTCPDALIFLLLIFVGKGRIFANSVLLQWLQQEESDFFVQTTCLMYYMK